MYSSNEWSLGLDGVGGTEGITGRGTSSEDSVGSRVIACEEFGILGDEETEDNGVAGVREDVEVRTVVSVETVEMDVERSGFDRCEGVKGPDACVLLETLLGC